MTGHVFRHSLKGVCTVTQKSSQIFVSSLLVLLSPALFLYEPLLIIYATSSLGFLFVIIDILHTANCICMHKQHKVQYGSVKQKIKQSDVDIMEQTPNTGIM